MKLVNFRDKGECYDIRVKDLSHLRIASIAVVGIAMKEEFKGLSEGEEYTGPLNSEDQAERAGPAR